MEFISELLTCLFLLFNPPHTIQSHTPQVEQLWKENQKLSLKSFYLKYENLFNSYGVQLSFETNDSDSLETLITADGEAFSPQLWENDLEKTLTQASNDFFKSKTISKAYVTYIEPLIRQSPHLEELKSAFEWFLIRYYYYFGSEWFQVNSKFSLYKNFNVFLEDETYKKALDQMLQAIDQAYPKKAHPLKSDSKKKVVLITGPYGGGHQTTAQVLEWILAEHPDYEVTLLDECDERPRIQNPHYPRTSSHPKIRDPDPKTNLFQDTLSRITQKYNNCRIYNDILVGENNPIKANLLYILNNKLTDYLPQNKFGKLYEVLSNLNPDLIISTVHHIDDLISTTYSLNIPLRILITDYEFPSKQWFHLNHIHSPLIKYWIPTTQKNFFRPMILDPSATSWENQLESSRSLKIYRLFHHSQEEFFDSILEKLEVFEKLPFPLATQIQKKTNEEDALESRRQLKLTSDPKRKIISIALGGTPNYLKIIGLINQLHRLSKHLNTKLELVVLAGESPTTLSELMEFLRQKKISYRIPSLPGYFPHSAANPFQITLLQKLDYPNQMANLYKASDVIISKAGGATTTEIIYSQSRFIRGFPIWPWEIENLKYLEYLGLAYPELPPHPELLSDATLSFDQYTQEPSDELLLDQLKQILFEKQTLPPSSSLPKRFESADLIQMADQTHQETKTFFQSRFQRLEYLSELFSNLEKSEGLKIQSFRPINAGFNGEIFLSEKNQQQWIVKVLKSNDTFLTEKNFPPRDPDGFILPDPKTNLLLSTEFNTLKLLFQLLPGHAPQAHYYNRQVLLKEFIPGKTLFQLFKKQQLTPEIRDLLLDLFLNLCQQELYVSDLHSFNLIYQEQVKRWYIIDAGDFRPYQKNACEQYYLQLTHSWKTEFSSLTDPALQNAWSNLQTHFLNQLLSHSSTPSEGSDLYLPLNSPQLQPTAVKHSTQAF